jgi:hypothetical protein
MRLCTTGQKSAWFYMSEMSRMLNILLYRDAPSHYEPN